jgi:hypothetical protein
MPRVNKHQTEQAPESPTKLNNCVLKLWDSPSLRLPPVVASLQQAGLKKPWKGGNIFMIGVWHYSWHPNDLIF